MTLVVAPVPMYDRHDELRQLVAHYGNLMSGSYERCSFSVQVSRRILTTLLRCAWAFFNGLSAPPKLQLRSTEAGWRDAGQPTKVDGEMALAGKADRIGNFGDRGIRFAQ